MGTQSLIEKEIDELYKKVAAGQRRGKIAGNVRRAMAYILKAAAAGGSLVVATGKWPEAHQACGVAVLAAVLLDTISSNHKRLLAEVKAGYAYEALRHHVKSDYNRAVDPLNKRLGAGSAESKAAEEAIASLQQKAHKTLSDGIEGIRTRLAQADVEALQALSLDHERAAAQQG
jgi:hypothetical protein